MIIYGLFYVIIRTLNHIDHHDYKIGHQYGLQAFRIEISYPLLSLNTDDLREHYDKIRSEKDKELVQVVHKVHHRF